MRKYLFYLIQFSLVLASTELFSQWATDPTINNPICVALNDQGNPAITSDGEGGAILVWVDNRGANTDIFAQRIDNTGNVKWNLDGVVICNANFSQVEPNLVDDGNGGAIIVWKDFRTGIDYDLYSQRIDANGTIMWQTNGIPICTAAGYQEDFSVVSDENGGAIIVWEDARVQGDFNIYAQRILNDGTVAWNQNGIIICSATNDQYTPTLISDESANSIITWEDKRNGVHSDIYAQLLNASGEPQWAVNGVPICTATDGQEKPKITGDGFGGALIVWRDHRGGFYDLYIQLINSLGITQWQTNGVLVLQAGSNPPDRVKIVSDDLGGAIICWDEDRLDQNYDIFAQRVSGTGTQLWVNAGIGICAAQMGQTSPSMIKDGEGGAIISWYDYRNALDWDIYAQRVNSSGEFLWLVDGVIVCSANNDQLYPVIVSDNDNGAIITWDDFRNITNENIYAQRVNKNGALGNPSSVETEQLPERYSLNQNYPNPFNPSTTIKYSMPTSEFVTLKVYDVLGNEVSTLVHEEKLAGSYEIEFTASELSSGIYFYKIQSNSFTETKKMILMK